MIRHFEAVGGNNFNAYCLLALNGAAENSRGILWVHHDICDGDPPATPTSLHFFKGVNLKYDSVIIGLVGT
jgi:hypothetical protein